MGEETNGGSRNVGCRIKDRGLGKYLDKTFLAEVKSGGKRPRTREQSGFLVENTEITYKGQSRFAIDPREEGKKKLNLVPGRTILNYKPYPGRYITFHYVS